MEKHSFKPFMVGEAVVAIEPIAQLEELECSAVAEDLAALEGIVSPSRRAEKLAWRRLARRLLASSMEQAQLSAEGVKIGFSYAPSGAPQIIFETQGQPSQQENSFINKYRYISVSHCRDLVAVVLSSEPCGVDLERVERNFERAAKRYLSPSEECLSDDPRLKAVVWCAKEAAYKIEGREGCNFSKDMVVGSLELTEPSALGVSPIGSLSIRCYDNPIRSMIIFAPTAEHILVVG